MCVKFAWIFGDGAAQEAKWFIFQKSTQTSRTPPNKIQANFTKQIHAQIHAQIDARIDARPLVHLKASRTPVQNFTKAIPKLHGIGSPENFMHDIPKLHTHHAKNFTPLETSRAPFQKLHASSLQLLRAPQGSTTVHSAA